MIIRQTIAESTHQKVDVRSRLLAGLFALIIFTMGTGAFIGRVRPELVFAVDILPNVLLAAAAVLVFTKPKAFGMRATNLLKFFIIFIIICFISWLITFSTYPILATYGFRALILGVTVAFIVQRSFLPSPQILFLKNAVLFVILLNCAFALKQAIVGLTTTEMTALVGAGSSYQVGETTRLLGLMATGQDLSVLSGAGVVWTLSVLAKTGLRNAGTLTIVVALSSSATTFLVLQRSALLGIAVGLLVTLLPVLRSREISGLRTRRGFLFMVLTAVVGGICLFGILIPERMTIAINRLQSLFGLGDDYSFNQRQETTLPVSLGLISDSPFGYGVGASGPVAAQQSPSGPLSDFGLGGIMADNGYLFIALQLGIVGLFCFVAMLYTWIRSGSFYHIDNADYSSGSSVIGFICGIMLSGTFWALTGPMVIIFILASIPLVQDEVKESR